MHYILASVGVVLAGVDGVFTLRRLRISPFLERNPLVRWIASHSNNVIATLVGVVGIQILILTAAAAVNTPIPISLFTGMSIYRTLIQFDSLQLESKLLLPKASETPALAQSNAGTSLSAGIGSRSICGVDTI